MILFFAFIASLFMPASVPGQGSPTAVDSTQVYYATQNVDGLKHLLATSTDRMVQLLCRYRLYPLTEDKAYLEDLPTELAHPTARELALLSGLWGYRVMAGSVLKAPRYGLRANKLLDQAKALDPDDAFVLLIDGQSLVFRPPVFGGDKEAALDRFQRLHEVIKQSPDGGISQMEADLWLWYALEKLEADEATTMRSQLLASNPPPLYRSFLMDPP